MIIVANVHAVGDGAGNEGNQLEGALADDLSGMTVNERLFVAGLLEAYDVAVATGDLNEVNLILHQVGLRQDEHGMNWSVERC